MTWYVAESWKFCHLFRFKECNLSVVGRYSVFIRAKSSSMEWLGMFIIYITVLVALVIFLTLCRHFRRLITFELMSVEMGFGERVVSVEGLRGVI